MLESVGIMQQAVEDGIGQGRVADHLAPIVDTELDGDDRGRAAVAIIHLLQQIPALAGCQPAT